MTKSAGRATMLWLLPVPFAAATVGWLAAARSEAPPAAIAGAGVLLSLIYMCIVIRTKLTRPLAALIESADELRNEPGFRATESVGERRDELGTIAHQLERMASQKHAADDARKRSETRTKALIETLSATAVRLDRNGLVLDQHVPDKLGAFSSAGLTAGAVFAELFPDTLSEVCRHAIALAFADGGTQSFEFKAEVDDESRDYQALFSQAGTDEAIAIVHDRTRQKQTHSSKQHLDTLLAATLDPILVISRYGEIRDANDAARKVLGIDILDQELSLIDYVPVHSRPLISEVAIPTAIQSGAWHGDTAFFDADGRELPVSLTAVPHRTEIGAAELVSLIVRDQSERKRFDEHLLFLEEHDPLTSLYTRKRFVEEVERETARADGRSGGAVVRIDLDDFKHVNDSFGYDTGDRLLQGVAKLLGGQIRAEDILARLDGDEFAILLAESRRSRIDAVLECFLAVIRNFSIAASSQPIGVTASAGVAFFPEHGSNPEELLARADQALDRAKQQGRNQFVVFKRDEEWQAQLDSRLSGDRRIREALASDRFALYLQPILDLTTDRVSFYEVLLRMLDEDGAPVPPGAFLDTAERFGLVRTIDRWVVRRAIKVIGEQRELGNPLRLSINLSGRSLGDFELAALVEEQLKEHNVDPGAITFEITESTASADAERARIFAIALKRIGCGIALDDFGVGFSSLHKLKSLPIDYLKIDGSFIADLSTSKVDQHLVRAVVELARALRKRTVAEYVENQETVELLKSAGVDFAQGFHIGKPRPVEELFPAPAECAASSMAE